MARPKPADMSRERAQAAIDSALRTLDAEGGGIEALATALRDGLGATFAAAVDLIRAAQGRVIVTGWGKSGHAGRKIPPPLPPPEPPRCSCIRAKPAMATSA